jgi:hypothetical protein
MMRYSRSIESFDRIWMLPWLANLGRQSSRQHLVHGHYAVFRLFADMAVDYPCAGPIDNHVALTNCVRKLEKMSV